MIGQTISHYRIIEKLGEGGMGAVYEAEDLKLGRLVALKFLSGQEAGHRERFLREARAAAALNHPNICTLYQVDEEHGFLAMELVEGPALKDKIAARPLKLEEALDIVEQVCEGLQESHEKGIVHRDIKPGNILITPKGQAKITDFGLATVSGGLRITKRDVVLGTPAYMSPEQTEGKTADRRSDIWALGVVLYEMVSGLLPFQGESQHAISYGIVNLQPEPLTALRIRVPVELDRIVGKMLAKNPAERYQYVSDVLVDLRALSKRLVKGAKHTNRAKKKRVLLLATAALALVLVPVGALLLRKPAESAKPVSSIAVLPLENLSGDPSQDYFADGATEVLITDLGKVTALRVISRAAVMRYKGTPKPPSQVARELNAQAVITGSVMRSGSRLRMTVHLLDASEDRPRWSESYERELKDVLDLQRELVRVIAGEVRVRLSPGEQTNLAKARAVDPDAYVTYLQGKFHANLSDRQNIEAAIELFERATSLDPNFAEAHAELAQALVHRAGLLSPDQSWHKRAFVAVEQALAIAPDSPDAHLARAKVLWTPVNGFPHEGAMREVRRALAGNPSLAEAHNEVARIYNHIGLLDEAIQAVDQGLVINPVSSFGQITVAQALLFQGNYERAVSVLQSMPSEAHLLRAYHLGSALFNLGRRQEASEVLTGALRQFPTDMGGTIAGVQAMLHAAAGDREKAKAAIAKAIAEGKGLIHFHHTAYNIGCAYALMREREQAMKKAGCPVIRFTWEIRTWRAYGRIPSSRLFWRI